MTAPTTPAPRRSNLLMAAAAFVGGVAGTAVVMSLRPSSPPASPLVDQKQAPRQGDAGVPAEKSHIHLSAEARESAGIKLGTARIIPMGDSLTVPGTIEVSPNRSAKITPPVAGKVVRLLANPGDIVSSGQPLAVLDSFEIAQARAAVKLAEANVQQAHAGVQTAQAETDQARATVRQAQAEVQQARSKQVSTVTALQRQREFAAAGAFSQAPMQAAQSELSTAQSELLQAQTNLQAHTVVMQRAERLFKAELVSRAELEQAQLEQQQDQTQVERARSRADIAKQALAREQKISSGDLLTKQAIQTSEAEVRSAIGDVDKAHQNLFRAQQDVRRAQKGEQAARTSQQGTEAALAAARSNLTALAGSERFDTGGTLTLRAPFGGTITERQATLGEAVERSTTLFVLENLNTVMVVASVGEKDVARIRMGQRVQATVAAYPGEQFDGIVQSVAGRVDEKTRALPVRCMVENRAGRLRPEMFATVSLGVGGRSTALAVPISALDQDGEDQFVYVEKDGYERRKVTLGRKDRTMAEILSGIKRGERIVTSGTFVLKSESKKGELKGDSD